MIRKILIPIILLSGALCFAGCVEERNDLEDGGSSDGGASSGGSSSGSGSASSGTNGSGNSSSPGTETKTKKYNFWTDDCATMGGSVNALGACVIRCETDGKYNVAKDNVCNDIEGVRCTTLGICLPQGNCLNKPGWHQHTDTYKDGTTKDDCDLVCNDKNDKVSCPSGLVCYEAGSIWGTHCTIIDKGGSSGGSGYCKELGCGGIFCSGKCVGCPGC